MCKAGSEAVTEIRRPKSRGICAGHAEQKSSQIAIRKSRINRLISPATTLRKNIMISNYNRAYKSITSAATIVVQSLASICYEFVRAQR